MEKYGYKYNRYNNNTKRYMYEPEVEKRPFKFKEKLKKMAIIGLIGLGLNGFWNYRLNHLHFEKYKQYNENASFLTRDWATKQLFDAVRNKESPFFIKAYLILGANAEAVETDDKFNILFSAVLYNNVEALNTLLDLGVDPNMKDYFGLSALHHAALIGNVDMISILVKHHKADVNIQDDIGMTPLMYAALKGNIYSVKVLLNLGANPFIRDKDHKNAYEYAIDNKRIGCARIIKKAMKTYKNKR